MDPLLENWVMASKTSVSFFWMALWAFILGYAISSLIQVFVTQERMQQVMGKDDGKSIALGAFFGFISSSCSFSALATTKSLFKKGAGFISSVAFLLASTNLVIELGMVIAVFLGWQFVVGEYVGGVLLILICWLLIVIIQPKKLIEEARANLGSSESDVDDDAPLIERVKRKESWSKVGKQYIMEWKMVWKDVTIGFTVAGIIAAFVPDAFFQKLFIETGGENQSYSFWVLLQHTIIGPVAAFMTFIGSMGNIPLAALLFGKGVSFAGVMAFIFSDLVVFPVLRINAKYYGWKMSLFILFLLFVALIATSLILHYSLDFLHLIPQNPIQEIQNAHRFEIDYTFIMNVIFIVLSIGLIYLAKVWGKGVHYHKEMAMKSPIMENILKYLAVFSLFWLAGGLGLSLILG
jgi:hypothetical protein